MNMTTTLTGLVTAEDLAKHNTSETAHVNRLMVSKTSEKPKSMGNNGIWIELLEA